MSKALGKEGEALFAQLAEKRGYQVEDVSDNEEYWYKDIDFFLTSGETGERKSFEVKYDTRINRTGNLYLEIRNKHSKDGIGWYNFTQADYLAYGNATSKVFYMFPMKELKERVEQLPKYVGFCGDDSCGYLVHISKIADLMTVLN